MYLYKLVEGECDYDGHEGSILLGHRGHFTEEEFQEKVVDVVVDAWVQTVALACEGKANKFGTSRWSEMMPQVADLLCDRHGFARLEAAVDYNVSSGDFDNENVLPIYRERQSPPDTDRRWLAIAERMHAAGCFKEVVDGQA